MAEELEKIYVIPLKKNNFKTAKAAPTAIKRVRRYLTKHMKVSEDNIWIDDSLNHALWKQGKYKIKSKIRVKAVKFDDGVVEAYLPELEFKKSRRELLKEEKEKKEPILLKEEVKEGEAEDIAGTDDYKITPSADGDVKIKKKKPQKDTIEKEEKKEKKKVSTKKDETKEKPASKREKKDKTKKSVTKKTSKGKKKTEKKDKSKPKEKKTPKKED